MPLASKWLKKIFAATCVRGSPSLLLRYLILRNVTGPLKVRTEIFAPPPLSSIVSSAPRPKRPGVGAFFDRLFVIVPAIVTIEKDAGVLSGIAMSIVPL